MSCLVFPSPDRKLTPERYETVMETITARLRGRVRDAFVFGSAGTDRMEWDSDIDLILTVDEVEDGFFWHRALKFKDLYDVFLPLDILVYTPDELARQLADSDVGFWKSVRESMRRLI